MKTINVFIEYIERHLFDELSADAVARAAYTNKYNAMRIFSAMTDYSLAEYVRLRRLSEAGRILCETNRRIIDIAYDCGYETAESFTKAFKKFNGFTPSECRRTHKYKTVPPWTSHSDNRILTFNRITFNGETFIGFRKRFFGKAERRLVQDERFAVSTRKNQEALRAVRNENDYEWWEILDNFDENGFDTTFSVRLEKSDFDYLSLAEKTKGSDYDFAFTAKELEKAIKSFVTYRILGEYVVFILENSDFPMQMLDDFTKTVYDGMNDYAFERDDTRPELLKICWYRRARIHERHLELFIPVK